MPGRSQSNSRPQWPDGATSTSLPIDAPDTRCALERLVARLTTQRLWHEDLVQEAMVHLWELEQRSPGRSSSWYLRSCQYHLLNHMRLGRSVDSPKRRAAGYVSINDHDAPEDWPEGLWERVAKDSSFEAIAARDLVQVLQQWLTPPEREILSRWADGLGPCETARQLRLSHTGVAQKRRQIAALLRALTAGTPSRRASWAS